MVAARRLPEVPNATNERARKLADIDDADLILELERRGNLDRKGRVLLPLHRPALPKTRGECPTERPCKHFWCRANLWTNTERPGRPYNGQPQRPSIEPKAESCALDVAAGEPDGIPNGKRLTVLDASKSTVERTRQVMNRGVFKVVTMTRFLELLEGMRPHLPGIRIETVYPRQNEAHCIHVRLVLTEVFPK